jgi:hypothetical protein
VRLKFTNKKVYEERFIWVNLDSLTIHLSVHLTKDRRHKEASCRDFISILKGAPKRSIDFIMENANRSLTINFARGNGVDLQFLSDEECELWYTALTRIKISKDNSLEALAKMTAVKQNDKDEGRLLNGNEGGELDEINKWLDIDFKNLNGNATVRQRSVEKRIAEERLAEETLADLRLAAEVQRLVEESLAEERLAEERLAEERLVEEALAEIRLAAEERLAILRLAEERLVEERLAIMRLAEERQIQRLADERRAEQTLAVERIAVQRLAEETIAVQRLAEERFAEQRLAEERLAVQRLANTAVKTQQVNLIFLYYLHPNVIVA